MVTATSFEALQSRLRAAPRRWLVTGVAGFIGSNLLETLLGLDQDVVGLDNFATGYQRNLDEVRSTLSPAQWSRFKFINGDIRVADDCRSACEGVDIVLHQAALGSVPRSILTEAMPWYVRAAPPAIERCLNQVNVLDSARCR